MDDLDPIFKRLGRQPVDDRLQGIDARVFARVNAMRERRSLRTTVGSLALGALAIGIAGGIAPQQSAAASALAILSAPPPLAPSKLLNAGYDR